MTMFNPNSHFADTFRNMKNDKSKPDPLKPALERAQLQSWVDELDDIVWLLGDEQIDNGLDRLDVIVTRMAKKLKEMPK